MSNDDNDRSPGWVKRRRQRIADDYADRTYQDQGGDGSSSPPPPAPKKPLCGITSKCAAILGKTAACPELVTMRWFRTMVMPGRDAVRLNGWLSAGAAMAAAVEALDEEVKVRLAQVYWEGIVGTVNLVKSGDFDGAADLYGRTFDGIKADLRV